MADEVEIPWHKMTWDNGRVTRCYCDQTGDHHVSDIIIPFAPYAGREDTDDDVFIVDMGELPEKPPEGYSGPNYSGSTVSSEERLADLLSPYGVDPVVKARTLLNRGQITEVKHENNQWWYNVMGSQLYVVKISTGDDYLFAECTCPNGTHSGGDARCYHSIAARVMALGLKETWIG